MTVNLGAFVNRAAALGDASKYSIQVRDGSLAGVTVPPSSKTRTDFLQANGDMWRTFKEALTSRYGRLALSDALIERRSTSVLTARAVMDTAKDYRLLARLSAENLMFRLHNQYPDEMRALMANGERMIAEAILLLRENTPGFDAQEGEVILEQVTDMLETMRLGDEAPGYAGSSDAIGLERAGAAFFGADETSVADAVTAGRLKKGDAVGGVLPDGGRYFLDGIKEKGVEPGFLVKSWLPSHEARMRGTGQAGTGDPLHQAAVTHLLDHIRKTQFSTSGRAGRAEGLFWNLLNHMAGMGDGEAAQRIAGQVSPKGAIPAGALGRMDQAVLRSYAALQLADQTEPFHDEFARLARKHLLETRGDFTRHIIKLDYNESERSAITKSLRLPDRVKQTHGTLYQFIRRQSVREANRGAVSEVLANDLTRRMGVPAQELRLLPATYSDGTPKLLLDGTFIQGQGGQSYRDFDFLVRDGYLDKELLRASGHTGRINSLGSYKAALLLLGDRDGVGSKGQNKGFVGNTFVAIDPGHSLEGNWVRVADDFSFTYSTATMFTKGFQNFTLFDDAPLSEKMAGWERIVRAVEDQGAKGIPALFASYRAAFSGNRATDFSEDIDRMRNEFMTRYQEMKATLAPRLALFRSDGPVPGDRLLDCLENVEKLTSETSASSPNRVVTLEHLRVVNRVPWDMERTDGGLRLRCRDPRRFPDCAATLDGFLAHSGAAPGLAVRDEAARSLTIAPENVEAFVALMSEENVKKYKKYI